MLSRQTRYVGIYELSLRASRHPHCLAPLTLASFKNVEAALKQAPIREEIEEGRLFISLDDVSVDSSENCVAMLFTVVDADAADAVFRKLKTNETRVFEKAPDEGGAASAHLVVDLIPEPNTLRYKTAFEDVEGVSRSRVVPFLERIFRNILGEVRIVTDDDEEIIGEAKLELDTVQQDKLSDAAGRPVAVEFVQLNPRKRLDTASGDRFYERNRCVSFSLNKNMPIAHALEALKQLRKTQKDNFGAYGVMRIRWQRNDSKTQTVTIDDIADDLLQRALTRLEPVTGFDTALPASMSSLRNDLVKGIMKILRKKAAQPRMEAIHGR